MAKKPSTGKNIHEGHRQRLKDRYRKEGLKNFSPHNILELLIGYAIPRLDVNPLAHQLMDEFGSLSAVFEADIENLCKISGVSEHTAILLSLIPYLARAYLLDMDGGRLSADDPTHMCRFLTCYFLGEKREKLVAFYLNNKRECIGISEIAEGTVNAVAINTRKIIDEGTKLNASSILLAHNHPRGTPMPSSHDLAITQSIAKLGKEIKMPLVDHVIVSGLNYRTLYSLTDPFMFDGPAADGNMWGLGREQLMRMREEEAEEEKKKGKRED